MRWLNVRRRLTSDGVQTQYEVLDMHRLIEAQKVYLRELSRNNLDTLDAATQDALMTPSTLPLEEDPTMRIVQALYWDRCAALRIEQVRPPRAYKLKNVWCRTDVGEWAGFRVRGKHVRHHAFESKLHETGKKNIQTRAAFVMRLRSYMQLPLEALSRREMVDLLAEAEVVRGDLVPVNMATIYSFNDAVGVLGGREFAAVFGQVRCDDGGRVGRAVVVAPEARTLDRTPSSARTAHAGPRPTPGLKLYSSFCMHA